MGADLNRVEIIGRLTAMPEMRYTPTGKAVCEFSVATNRTWRNEQGERQKASEFHDVVAWELLAEIVSDHARQGTLAFVEGRLETQSWTDASGAKHRRTRIVASEVKILGRAARQAADEDAETSAAAPVREAVAAGGDR